MAKSQKQGRQEAAGGNGSGEQKAGVGAGGEAQAGAGAMKQDAETLLRADHRKVEDLFRKFEGVGDEASGGRDRKKELASEICKELVIHSRLEEEIFYAACRQKDVEDDLLDEAQVEHDSLKLLIADLLEREPGSPYYDAKVTVLSEYVKHHVTEEEKATSGIFAKARTAGVDMDAVGERLLERKQQLVKEMEQGVPEAPKPRSFSVWTGGFDRDTQETGMARSYERDRQYGGRWRQDEDRERSAGRYEGRDDERDERYRRLGGYTERMGQGAGAGYPERSRRSEPRGRDERDRAGGYYGGSTPDSSRGADSGYSGGGYGRGGSESARDYRGGGRTRGYGGTERYEGDYGGSRSQGDEYFSGSRGYTGSATSGGRDEDDWSTHGIGGSREGYGRPRYGSFEREGSEYGRSMGREDRGRMGGRNRSEDDESYVRGGGQARFGNRSGNYSNDSSDDGGDDYYSPRRRSEYEGRGGRSGGTGGWRNRGGE